ncbi:MAG: hypothetical protein RR728_01315 [Oscillospiraceae bacterium]
MDKQQEMHNRLLDLAQELSYCGSFLAFLHWDTGTFCPPGGQGARAKLSGYLAKMTARLNTGKEALEILDYYSSHSPDNEIDGAILRELRKLHSENEKLGSQWRVRYSELTSIGKSKWLEARSKNDFSIFEPVLRETFDMAREKGKILGCTHPMEAFINDWDRGITVDSVDKLFVELKAGILDIYEKIRSTGKDFDDELLQIPMDKAALKRCGQIMAKAIGYKEECGGFFETIHPYAAPIAPTDARICTNFSNYTNGIYSTLHEAGHSIYQQCVPPELCYTNLRGGWPGMLHESQSLFYENIVGKSFEFTKWSLPIVQKELPQFKDVTARQLYQMANRVQPQSLARTSEELSGCLRPLMCYEIEKQMMDGSLDVHDLPEAWNEYTLKYFGTHTDKLQEGALRGMQWAIGALGFFQSYPLGNIIDGQLRYHMLKENPNLPQAMEKGDFTGVTAWLGEKIHSRQKVPLPLDILRDATGEELTATHYVDYLNEKYSDIYGF